MGQFIIYTVFVSCFILGGWLIENSFNDETGKYDIDPESILISIFAILFSAS